MKKVIRLLLADDHALVRAGLRELLLKIPDLEVVAEASNGREVLEQVNLAAPDLVLLDIGMKELNGLEVADRLVREHRDLRVLMLSMHANEEYVLRALRAGASGYILKDSATTELKIAIESVLAGKTYLSPQISRSVIDSYLHRTGTQRPAGADQLTPRQREVLQLMAEGNSTKEIAGQLGLSVKTVETHRAQLMERLSIYDVASLVRFAIREGMVQAD